MRFRASRKMRLRFCSNLSNSFYETETKASFEMRCYFGVSYVAQQISLISVYTLTDYIGIKCEILLKNI